MLGATDFIRGGISDFSFCALAGFAGAVSGAIGEMIGAAVNEWI